MEKPLRVFIPTTAPAPNYLAALEALEAAPETGDRCPDPAAWDGLLLPGGGDLDPRRYGEENLGSRGIDRALDALQCKTLEAFLGAGKPVLGICRGHQLLNVFLGGSLLQDIPGPPAHPPVARGVDRVHEVAAQKGSWLADLYGERFSVNSAHHQALARLGEGLSPVAWAPDGIIEAAAHERLPLWSVQFHPERLCFSHRRPDAVDGSAVLRFFLARCRERV